MKTAIIHDWLVSLGGAEKVLCSLLEIYPSPLFTLVTRKQVLHDLSIPPSQVATSWIQKLPLAERFYRNYLPFFPLAIERFNLNSYDLVLSSSHAVAKGVKTHANQLHICYCHTPMRYAWDLQDQYLNSIKGVQAYLARYMLKYLRRWDLKTVSRVDHFIANSHYIAKRIQQNYDVPAHVIYPPVATHLFQPAQKKKDFYLTVSRLVPYKRVDLIVEAFTQMPSRSLYVVGAGSELEKIRLKAGPNIHFLGFQPDALMRKYLAEAKAFVFAAEEDFGIVPVEAQAAGTPVIAYAKGGVLETVIPAHTGLFFEEQTPLSLIQAVERFETMAFDAVAIRQNAERFSEERFKQEIKQFVEEKWKEFCENHHTSRR